MIPVPPAEVTRRLSRRGAMLLTLGLTYVLVGFGALLIPVDPERAAVLYFALPGPIRASLWFASGAVACVFAWRRRDWIGYVALFIAPTIRCLSYIVRGVLGASLPDFYSGVIQAPFVAVAIICSGWRDRRRGADGVPGA